MAAPAPSPSLERLNMLAADLNRNKPSTYPTAEVAFAKVYADPRNRELVAAERRENRPNGGGSAPVGDRVSALAASLARAHRDLSHADAVKVVLERNPILAVAYRQEQSGQ